MLAPHVRLVANEDHARHWVKGLRETLASR